MAASKRSARNTPRKIAAFTTFFCSQYQWRRARVWRCSNGWGHRRLCWCRWKEEVQLFFLCPDGDICRQEQGGQRANPSAPLPHAVTPTPFETVMAALKKSAYTYDDESLAPRYKYARGVLARRRGTVDESFRGVVLKSSRSTAWCFSVPPSVMEEEMNATWPIHEHAHHL